MHRTVTTGQMHDPDTGDEADAAAAAARSRRPDAAAHDDRAHHPATHDATGTKNLHQLIELRWIALAGQVVTILVVHFGFGIRLPLGPMFFVLELLLAFNVISALHLRRHSEITNGALLFSLLVDVVLLTALLYLSGGAANPFVFLYLLQVVLGAVLLRPWSSWIVVAATTAGFVGLTMFSGPVVIPADPTRGLADPYVQGLLICFALNATLLVVFITRIGGILRARDARLASLRQRAAEQEHIVRMGLLASGAAHELGTPLATVAVILGDWRHMPAFSSQPELVQDIDEMQAQLKRCKTILTGILLSAGESRGEAPIETTLAAFLDTLVAEWRSTRSSDALHYTRQIDEHLAIVSDTGLRQMVDNVLDNALEASPAWLSLEATQRDGELILSVSDRGAGFEPGMLAQIGKPYQSSKGRPGGGLGLFLSLNVARSLGGSLSAQPGDSGGAVVTMTLPLSTVALHEDARDDDA